MRSKSQVASRGKGVATFPGKRVMTKQGIDNPGGFAEFLDGSDVSVRESSCGANDQLIRCQSDDGNVAPEVHAEQS
jgi:hypothetical protein